MQREKSAEAMWKQIFQIQKYDLVNWKLKRIINLMWETNTIENTGAFFSILRILKKHFGWLLL